MCSECCRVEITVSCDDNNNDNSSNPTAVCCFGGVSSLVKVYSVAIECGATTINVPDTVGYTTPKEFMGLMHHLRRTVRCIPIKQTSIIINTDILCVCVLCE